LNDETMLLRDLYDAQVGVSHSLGPVRVREIAASHGALTPGAETPSQAQVLGALAEIQASQPALAQALAGLAPALATLRRVVSARSGQEDQPDLSRLAPIGKLLAQVGAALGLGGAPVSGEAGGDAQATVADAQPPAAGAPRGDGDGIHNRQDALRMLDRVIAYFEQAEPGNPAPLLLSRAKQLIGVSFLDIMANLAPNALDTIETVTGRRPSSD
jgi:type VI secretion system protein ImpA